LDQEDLKRYLDALIEHHDHFVKRRPLENQSNGSLGDLGVYPYFRCEAELMGEFFRINEFSVEAMLSLFLPYHETPHFAKVVTILHFK
jgi:hypothetical protein